MDKGVNLYAYNIFSGKREWEWHHNGKVNKSIHSMWLKGNILVMDIGPGIIALNLDTKAVLWEVLHEESGHTYGTPFSLQGNFAYKYLQKGDFNYPSSSIYVRYDILTGKEETIFTVFRDSIWSPQLSGLALYKDINSDDTLAVVVVGWGNINKPPQDSPTDLRLYNLKTKKLVWEIKKFCKIGTGLNYKPVIYGNDVIIQVTGAYIASIFLQVKSIGGQSFLN
ncbi:MAG: hypothetical protein IPO92_13590 [Saprospiraceae bacterium]|nr:hypothetical protein [Saprospiraceae bacterium]